MSKAILSSTSWKVVTLQHFSNLTTGYWPEVKDFVAQIYLARCQVLVDICLTLLFKPFETRLFLEENAKINLPTLTRFNSKVCMSSPWSKEALEMGFFIVILSSSLALCTFSFSKSIRPKFCGIFFERLEKIQHCSFALKLSHQHKTSKWDNFFLESHLHKFLFLKRKAT